VHMGHFLPLASSPARLQGLVDSAFRPWLKNGGGAPWWLRATVGGIQLAVGEGPVGEVARSVMGRRVTRLRGKPRSGAHLEGGPWQCVLVAGNRRC
jgi:hypothetical protein